VGDWVVVVDIADICCGVSRLFGKAQTITKTMIKRGKARGECVEVMDGMLTVVMLTE